jgi:hypothetical protein
VLDTGFEPRVTLLDAIDTSTLSFYRHYYKRIMAAGSMEDVEKIMAEFRK